MSEDEVEVFTFTAKPVIKDHDSNATIDDADASESFWQPNFTSQFNGFGENFQLYDDDGLDYNYDDYYGKKKIGTKLSQGSPYDSYKGGKSQIKRQKSNKKIKIIQNAKKVGYNFPSQQNINRNNLNWISGGLGTPASQIGSNYVGPATSPGLSRWDQGYGSYGGGYGYGPNNVNIRFRPNLMFRGPQQQNFQIFDSFRLRIPGLPFPTDLGICPDIVLAAIIAAGAVAALAIYIAIVAAGRRRRRSSSLNFYSLLDAALSSLMLGMKSLVICRLI